MAHNRPAGHYSQEVAHDAVLAAVPKGISKLWVILQGKMTVLKVIVTHTMRQHAKRPHITRCDRKQFNPYLCAINIQRFQFHPPTMEAARQLIKFGLLDNLIYIINYPC